MLSAQVSEDSALWEGFEEYQEANGFESRSEALRAALRDGIEADRARREGEPSVDDVRQELRDELHELQAQQRTPLEEAFYLLAAVVAGTAPLVGFVLTTTTTLTLAFVGGLLVALTGLFIGAVTKIVADNSIRQTDSESAATADESEVSPTP
jgi:Arc/MetJ-type ribon-helix-helix transcriptional regulator